MQSLLFLCHRLPWPPDKGDKIRSYHVLRRLAENWRVYLGTFVDDPRDWRHVDEVKNVCADVCVRSLPSWRARARALGAFARGDALTLGCYRDRVMRRWVDRVVAEQRPGLALCYSSGVAPLVMRHSALPRVMDFVDADSDKWRQYAETRSGPARWIYAREARKLAAFERSIASRFDAGVFVSDAEAGFFREEAPQVALKIHGIANGVDADYWNPDRAYPNPYRSGEHVVVFVGAMDYRANVHAATWFADEVWPKIRSRHGNVRFCIVGARPAREVRLLGERPGITVTGQVDDVRPYLAHAHAVTTPLRIARGIQNKVLEALAMEKVVLSTPEAWEGIGHVAGHEGCVTSSVDTMVCEALRSLEPPQPRRVPAVRVMVRREYDWTRNLDAYEHLLRRVRNGQTAVHADEAITLGVAS